MIGVFDSGIGGLSVLSQMVVAAPGADFLYVADRLRAPFGEKPLETVREISHEIADWIIAHSIETIVIACNTASAAALDSLRAHHPYVEFVGMEPAVKPAAASTRSGVIGVLATRATFQGRLFGSVVARYAGEARVVTSALPHWVEFVEAGQVNGTAAEEAVRDGIAPLLDAGADLLVIGCTHFSFLKPIIERTAGPSVEVIDPAPAVAAQALRVCHDQGGSAQLLMAASGDIQEFTWLATAVAGVKPTQPVLPFPW